jgi:OOP family OmpA-OmpF porin
MRKLTIAAAIASTCIATAANARDASPYIGLDFGLTKPQATPLRLTDNAGSIGDAVVIHHHVGFEGDFVVGYDFGMFRLEGEAAYQRSSLKRTSVSNAAAAEVDDPGLATSPVSTSGHVTVGSGMINALLDLEGAGVTASVGGGFGYARVRYNTTMNPSSALAFRDDDAAFAYQLLAEIHAPISDHIDVGLKYKYFSTMRLDYGPFCQTTCPSLLPFTLRGKYRSNSLLASLTYNFGAVAAPPPPPPPAPPPPPPPATQTCPDGSVILATDACPAPPPPAPAPAPAPERGS